MSRACCLEPRNVAGIARLNAGHVILQVLGERFPMPLQTLVISTGNQRFQIHAQRGNADQWRLVRASHAVPQGRRATRPVAPYHDLFSQSLSRQSGHWASHVETKSAGWHVHSFNLNPPPTARIQTRTMHTHGTHRKDGLNRCIHRKTRTHTGPEDTEDTVAPLLSLFVLFVFHCCWPAHGPWGFFRA